MSKVEYLDYDFLSSLRTDTQEINPQLLDQLFAIYFSSFYEKIELLEKAASEKNEIELSKVSHYMKGQSACMGIVYFSDRFMKIEKQSYTKTSNFSEIKSILDDLKLHYPAMEQDVIQYLKSIKKE